MSRVPACLWIGLGITSLTVSSLSCPWSVQALPPPDDVPEELLRSELILQGRSPLDNSPLSPTDYAALEAELAEFPADSLAVNPELQSLLFQLKLLNLLKDLLPFL